VTAATISPLCPEAQLAASIAEFVEVSRRQLADIRELRRILAVPVLGQCQMEEPVGFHSQHNAARCCAEAAIFNLDAELEVCLAHHRELVAGHEPRAASDVIPNLREAQERNLLLAQDSRLTTRDSGFATHDSKTLYPNSGGNRP